MVAMRLEEIGEFGLIERIQQLLKAAGSAVILGVGDDAAAMRPSPGTLLLATCDSQVEGRHFRRSNVSAEQLGRRLAAVNLSDIAAMGGRPRWALASLTLPATLEVEFIDGLYAGLIGELARFGAVIAGGNISGGDSLVLDLTLLGEAAPERVLRRSGAQPGDAILVTGSLGASASGRAALDARLDIPGVTAAVAAHLTPQARVTEGLALAGSGRVTAMLDVSDGLARDLGHLCDASGAGAIIELSLLPVSDSTRAVASALGLDPIVLALSGGEDYELLCTAPVAATPALIQGVHDVTGLPLTRIGTITAAEEGRWLLQADGSRAPLANWGWQHFGDSTPPRASR